jgi:glucosylceramidase
MNKLRPALLSFALNAFCAAFAATTATVERTVVADAPAPQPVSVFSAPVPEGEAPVRIEVDTTRPGQTMDGIGGAFNEMGWEALKTLPADQRTAVLRALFDTKEGAAMRFNRIPIGASDFALSAYSLAEEKDDYGLKSFSVKRDEACLLQYIKAAQAVNPEMRFHASPWSPPAWMKTNGKLTGGGTLKDDERTLKAHADYLVKFLKAYRERGVAVERLCPQNEPLIANAYPGCKIPGPLYGKAVKDFIIPAVKASGLPVEVWAGTLNYSDDFMEGHFRAVLADDAMAKAVGGIAFQYSHLAWVKEYRAKHPDTKMMFSEAQCYSGQNTPENALRDFEDFAAYARNGCSLFTFWNMVLPSHGKSTWGWKQNAPVSIDMKTGLVTYRPSYAVARLLGRHVVPGTKYLPATVTTGDAVIGAMKIPPLGFREIDLSGGEQVVAFAKPDGSTVVYLLNQGTETKVTLTLKTTSGAKDFDTVLPAKTLCAIVVK